MLPRTLKVLAIGLLVPALGWLIAQGMIAFVAAHPGYVLGHASYYPQAPSADELETLRALRERLRVVQVAATVAAALPAALIGFQVFAAYLAAGRRTVIAALFPAVVHTTGWLLIPVILSQIGLSFAVLWLAESVFLNGIHFGLLWGVGFGGLFAVFALAKATIGAAAPVTHVALAQVMREDEHPQLLARVRSLAERIGARPPDWIVGGPDPGFYVTSIDTRLAPEGRILQGETLYLSLPGLSLLTLAEFDAVVGHELGHFRGEDTAYTTRFLPIQARLLATFGALVDNQGRTQWAAVPALFMAGFLVDLFAEATAAVERAREFEADRAGAEAAGPMAVATSLIKLGMHSSILADCLQRVLVGDARADRLLEEVASCARQNISPFTWKENVAAALEQHAVHPTDRHPPDGVRLAALGVDVGDIEMGSLLPPGHGSALTLVGNPAAICTELIHWWRQELDLVAPTGSVLAQVSDGVRDPVAGLSRG